MIAKPGSHKSSKNIRSGTLRSLLPTQQISEFESPLPRPPIDYCISEARSVSFARKPHPMRGSLKNELGGTVNGTQTLHSKRRIGISTNQDAAFTVGMKVTFVAGHERFLRA